MSTSRTLWLQAAGGRRVEVSLFGPERASPIVFSHGANAAPSRYRALLDAWGDAGFLVCAPLHVDSEEYPQRVTDDPARVRRSRIDDFARVVAMLADGARAPAYVAAGHSYGALIAQVAGGAVLEAQPAFAPIDPPAGVIALSPPPAMPGLIRAGGWARMRVPMLCVTGTADVMPGFVDDWRQHLAAYDAVDHGFALVVDGMDHYFNGAFGRLRDGGADRARAVDALNAVVADFAQAWTTGNGVAAAAWAAGAQPGLSRRAK